MSPGNGNVGAGSLTGLSPNISMIKSTANSTVKTQSSDNNWNLAGGAQEPGETKSAAGHLIQPVWVHKRVGWAEVCTAKPGEKMI